jgi:hypothetical protein
MKVVHNIYKSKTKTNEHIELWKYLKAKWDRKNSGSPVSESDNSIRQERRSKPLDCERSDQVYKQI